MKKLLMAGILVSPLAQANIVCRGETSMGPVTVEIAQDKVTISGAALEQPSVYTSLQTQWDGHMTELITAPGLAISFEDWYGCIHNAKITANFRTNPGFIQAIEVAACSGGSTSDQDCRVR